MLVLLDKCQNTFTIKDQEITYTNVNSEKQLTLLLSNNQRGHFLLCCTGLIKISIDGEIISIGPETVTNIIHGATVDILEYDNEPQMILISYSQSVKNIIGCHSLIVFCPGTGLLQNEFSHEQFSEFLFYAKKIERSVNNDQENETALLHLVLIVRELSKLSKVYNSKRRITNEIILNFINLLDQHHRMDKTIEMYCEELNISSKTLYRAFKGNIGLSPKEFMNFKLNMEAKKLLTHSKLSIKEVSSELGFQSQYYFTNFFKKVNNISPSLFKESLSDFSIRMS